MATEEENFNLPEGYFNNLAENIRVNVFIADLKENNLDTGFTVPINYFETLRNKLSETSKVSNQQTYNPQTKILKLNFIKYAAAACILIVCGLAIYLNVAKNNLQNQLANLPNEDLELYLQNNTNSTDLLLIIENVNEINVNVDKNISTQEINEYLNETI